MPDKIQQIRTFVFTDIKGSTHLARKLGEHYPSMLSTYRSTIRGVIKTYDGIEVDCTGDGFFIAFSLPVNAARAAIDIQKKLKTIQWPEEIEIHVRIGIHTGRGVRTDSGYTGLAVHMTSRICDAAHGGQILLSASATREIEHKMENSQIDCLGKFHLKGFETPQEICQLTVDGLQLEFPPPRVLPALPVIAVLPFRDESQSQENAYFFEGVSTDIIHALARLPGLRVVARSASRAFKRSKEDIFDIGSKLNANAVLHGSMQKQNQKIRISFKLADIDERTERWSRELSGDLDDIFEMQDAMTQQVAESLGVSYQQIIPTKQGVQFRTQSIESYDFYLKGRRFYYQFSKQSVLFALQMFQKAIQIDYDFALAYAGAADCYSYLYMYEDPNQFNRQSAEQMSLKAIELNPSLAEAHASRGVVLSLSKDYVEAEACFEKAISLDPQLFEAYYLYARVEFAAGKLQKAAGLYRDANRVRPDDYQSLLLAAQCFEKLDFFDRAKEVREDGIEIVKHHLKLNPGDTRALYMGANGQAALGNHLMASKWLQRALLLEPDDPMLLYNAGCIYALMGMHEEGLESLDRSVDAGLTQKEWFANDPDLNGLRSQPRFHKILEKLDQVIK